MHAPTNPRTRIAVLAVPMVAFTVAAYAGNALAPTLVNEGPIALLLLSPKIRWLLLASPNVDAIWFFGIPLARAVLLLGTYFLLGRWYGDRALRWLESRSGNALRPVLWIERKFHGARGPVTFLFPGNVAAMLAGADAMPLAQFLAIALLSIGLRLWAVRALAEVFHGPLVDILEWIGDNQLWLTVISVGGVIGWAMWSNRHGLTQGETIEEIIEDFESDSSPAPD
ncbi:MAG: hypothetical protein JJE46_13340 [Acidimicrobiia bacterium]|nr:hypothetical protein [Acidimicrobiia bacterium]